MHHKIDLRQDSVFSEENIYPSLAKFTRALLETFRKSDSYWKVFDFWDITLFLTDTHTTTHNFTLSSWLWFNQSLCPSPGSVRHSTEQRDIITCQTTKWIETNEGHFWGDTGRDIFIYLATINLWFSALLLQKYLFLLWAHEECKKI